MSDYKHLILEKDDQILTITINRPEKLNALNMATITEIGLAIRECHQSTDLKGAIITGSGEKAFVAGADISEISGLDAKEAETLALNGQKIFAAIENGPKPVIAAVNGYALGGGCELAMACHLRIASPNARFGQPEVNLGLVPGYGGTQRLAQLIGKGKAMELLMTAEQINAEEALKLGLVNQLSDDQESLIKLCKERLGLILSKAPLAIEKVIRCVNGGYDPGIDGYLLEAGSFGECGESEDFIEGTAAFLEKRKANFKGK